MTPVLDNVQRLAAVQQQATELDIELPAPTPLPKLSEDALHGPVGRYVRRIEPHTEADPAGVLVQQLIMYGNVIGRGPHFRVEADQHYLNIFGVMVGETSKGRKGVSAGQAKRLFRTVDPDWCDHRIEHGLSSGEGLIWAVRDSIEKSEDPGVADKRLLVLESEFASTLRVLKREGNTLSIVIRNAWDTGRLSTLTKNSPARATGAHISIAGHITKTELLRYLDSTEAANGFGNRFLWCCVRRSKCLPEGGAAHTLDFGPEIRELREILDFARRTGEIKRDEEARKIWADVYPELSEGKPGLLGSMIGRAEAQTMRLACLYAVLDRSNLVQAEHLVAALALWQYCEESARWIFGEALGDPIADEILRAMRYSPDGLTRTDIAKLFGNHRKKQQLSRALTLLHEQGLATFETESTTGRSRQRWKAMRSNAK